MSFRRARLALSLLTRRIAPFACLLLIVAIAGCAKKGKNTSDAPMGTKPDYAYEEGPYDYGDAGYGGDGGGYTASEAESAPAPDSPPLTSRRSSRRSSRRMGTEPGATDAEPIRRRDRRVARRERVNRQGIGTAYGEQRNSRVVTTPFHRASSSPDVVLAMNYNDWEGIETLAASFGRRQVTQATSSSGDGRFSFSVVDAHGRVLPASDVDGRRYTEGSAGTRYQLRISNNTAFRFEVVASVDGLDVIDGDEAGYHKRGYILDPWTTITIDGWRTSDDTVAAFRFSDIGDSYADRTGRPRNIGVIGVAFFHEEGTSPWEDLERRHRSDPFPGRFTPPPPPRWR